MGLMRTINKTRRYAEGTSVSTDKSRIEIEQLLAKHGATQRSLATDDDAGRVVLTFRIEGRIARLVLKADLEGLPAAKEAYDPNAPRGWAGWSVDRRQKWVDDSLEQRWRESWRRLLLVLKAKFEIVASGESSFEREFLSDILLPDGRTVHQFLATQINDAYESGAMPPMLPAHTE